MFQSVKIPPRRLGLRYLGQDSQDSGKLNKERDKIESRYEAKRHRPASGLQAGSLVTFYTGPSCRPSPHAGRAPCRPRPVRGGRPAGRGARPGGPLGSAPPAGLTSWQLANTFNDNFRDENRLRGN